MTIDMFDDPSLNFSVIAYRGSPVASRAGWVADAQSRGGVITQVPGGFFHDIEAARFGVYPYTYELPPVWLLVWDGVDVAADEFNRWVDYQAIAVAADNQRQSLVDIATKTKDTVNNAVNAVPTVLVALAVLAGLILLYQALQFLPRPVRR